MAEIIVIGGGVVGLSTATLLARDGHRVKVLERDGAPPPRGAAEAWADWDRRGVNQFRMVHIFLPRFRALLEAELPEVATTLEEMGALRLNFVAMAPESLTGGFGPGDERFTMLTARRPVVEAALAHVAAGTAGLEIMRGAAVAGFTTGSSTAAGRSGTDGVPHVTGVRTEDGREFSADLVVDAGGRRSAVPRLLHEAGAGPVAEELEDSGFVYYARHFRSADGSTPAIMSGLLSAYGSVSILTLPADNGTWGVGFIASSQDAAARGLRDPGRWAAALKEFPLVAHWGEGETLDDDVAVMAKLEDRIRSFVVEGEPVATGVVPVADAWACTNPSLGRGASLGLLHSVALRDQLRRVGPDQHRELALAWDDTTRALVEPWYRSTVDFDRHRLAEIEANIAGLAYDPQDVGWELTHALLFGSNRDPAVFRGSLKVAAVLETADEVLAEPGFADKVLAVGSGWREAPVYAPTRERLVELATG